MRSAKFGHGTNSNFIWMPVFVVKSFDNSTKRVGRIPCGPAKRDRLRLRPHWGSEGEHRRNRDDAGACNEFPHDRHLLVNWIADVARATPIRPGLPVHGAGPGAGMFRESCLVSRCLLNIARGDPGFFHAAVQRKIVSEAALSLFSKERRCPRRCRDPYAHIDLSTGATRCPGSSLAVRALAPHGRRSPADWTQMASRDGIRCPRGVHWSLGRPEALPPSLRP